MKHRRWLRKHYRIGRWGVPELKRGKKHRRVDNRATNEEWWFQLKP